MDILSVLFNPILPVFAIMAFGFGMGRTGMTSAEDAVRINRFAMTVLLPILIFDLIANAPVRTFSPAPIAVYAAVQAVVFTAGYLIAARLFHRAPEEAVLLAFCGIFANNAFYVLPISVLLYGEAGVLPITSIVTLDATVSFGGVMIALQIIKLGSVRPGDIARSLGRAPIL